MGESTAAMPIHFNAAATSIAITTGFVHLKENILYID
jgi:hypothetical protein